MCCVCVTAGACAEGHFSIGHTGSRAGLLIGGQASVLVAVWLCVCVGGGGAPDCCEPQYEVAGAEGPLSPGHTGGRVGVLTGGGGGRCCGTDREAGVWVGVGLDEGERSCVRQLVQCAATRGCQYTGRQQPMRLSSCVAASALLALCGSCRSAHHHGCYISSLQQQTLPAYQCPDIVLFLATFHRCRVCGRVWVRWCWWLGTMKPTQT